MVPDLQHIGPKGPPESPRQSGLDVAFGVAWRPTRGVTVKVEGTWHEPDGATEGDMSFRAGGGVSL